MLIKIESFLCINVYKVGLVSNLIIVFMIVICLIFYIYVLLNGCFKIYFSIF